MTPGPDQMPDQPASNPGAPAEEGTADYAALVRLLERRLAVIADHAWRDRDPDGQMRALQEVSQEIADWAARHAGATDFHMQHYLQNCSFDKALAVARKRAAQTA